MTTMTVVQQSGGKVQALSLSGVSPDEANVTSGRYLLVREAYFVTTAQPSPAVAAFVAFVMSPAGASVIKANGAIPAGAR
jgi:phosphate transport system substrate-binding protein